MLQGCLYRRCKPRHIESLGLGRLIVISRSLLIIVVSPQWDIPMHDQTGAAISAGARVASRLFNAIRPIHHTGSRADHHAAG